MVDKDRITRFIPDDKLVFEKLEKLSTGLGTNNMESKTIVLEMISLGREKFKNYRIVALDLSHVNQSYNMLGLKNIDGVIGGDLLDTMNAVINYGKKVLTIHR